MVPQFTTRAVLICVTIVAGYCALLARWPLLFGLLAVPIVILGLTYCTRMAGGRINRTEAIVLAMIGFVLAGLLLPAVQMAGSGPRHECLNNLRYIALALQNYHGARHSYPPAYLADKDGQPLVSWRLLILPYMKGSTVYDDWEKHRDEPWDGPNNKRLSETPLAVYHCPDDPGPTTDTSYVAVVGPGTIWPLAGKVKDSQITDGMSNTLIVVEVVNSGINWMEPRDLDFHRRTPGAKSQSGLGVSSNHPACVCVAFADGRVQTLDKTITDEQLRALLTIAGGEKIVLP